MPKPAPDNPFEARPWACLAVSATGTFMATLDGGIVNVALPGIAQGFGADLLQAQWVVSGYLLTISCLLPALGRLGDLRGRRASYRLGFAVFAAASALCALSPSVWGLVAARVLQAVGAALLMANGPAIVIMSFPGANRGRALGLIGMVVSLGSLAGPALGGLLISRFGWPMLFYINVPIGILGVYLSHKVLPNDTRPPLEGFDLVGSALYAAGMVGLLMAVTHGGRWGYDSPETLGCTLFAGVGLLAFLRRQYTSKSPLVDLSLFRIRSLALGNLASLCCFMAMFTNIILLPFLLTQVAGFSPADTGLAMAVQPLAMAFVAPLSGLASEKVNHALLTGLGLGVLAAALYAQTLLGPSPTLLRAALGQAAIGVGAGIFMSPNNSAVLGSAPRAKSGVAGSLMSLVRNLGMVGGVALATAIFEAWRAHALALGVLPDLAFLAGFQAALLAGCALAALGAVLAAFRCANNRPA